jgi:signal peptidase I
VTSDDRDPTTVAEPDEPVSRSSHVTTRDLPKKKHLPVWQETILLLGIALVLAIDITALFVQA